MKKAGCLLADNLIRPVETVLAEFGLLKKTISDAGRNFMSHKLRQSCRKMNIEQAITSSYLHQSIRQVEGCIKFVNHTIKKYLHSNSDNLTMLQMTSTPIGAGLPIPFTLLFNRPSRALLPNMNREPITFNADNEHYETLRICQDKYINSNDTHKCLI